MKEEIISKLMDKDPKIGYQELLKLEILTAESDDLYKYFDEFITMLNNNNSYIRVRGFRMISALAKWDNECKINNNIDKILILFDDKKSLALRQYLEAVKIILLYKPELSDKIVERLNSIDYLKFNESMQRLIEKDIKNILNNI